MGVAPGVDQSALSYVADATGIHSLVVDGIDLFEGVGGYYVIGSCSGADTEAENVISLGSNGSVLHAPGSCVGAPFSMSFSGQNPIRVSISVGPLPVSYRTLSVPFDPKMAYFDRFAISGNSYEVGCANSWSPRQGSGGQFSTIPQPCQIPGHGAVGMARVKNVPSGWWGEIDGSVTGIRRVILSGNVKDGIFVNHPYTHNVELAFSQDPITATTLPAGTSYSLEEELYILDSATGTEPNAEIVSVNIPATGIAGEQIAVSVTMRNTGDTTWIEPSDHMGGVRLGTLVDNAIDWLPGPAGGYAHATNDQRLYLAGPVVPGTEVTFAFTLQMPASAGDYALSASMVHDGVAWFGQELHRSISVTAAPCGGQPVNTCGGCSVLAAVPGNPCQNCGHWICAGSDSLRCALPDGGCGSVLDAALPDTSVPDTSRPDTGVADSGRLDTGLGDNGLGDNGLGDNSRSDTALPDSDNLGDIDPDQDANRGGTHNEAQTRGCNCRSVSGPLSVLGPPLFLLLLPYLFRCRRGWHTGLSSRFSRPPA